MGIRFLCPACQKKVHVKDHQAGLRGFCPKCQARIDIPWQSTLPAKKRSSNGDAASPELGSDPDVANPAAAAIAGSAPLQAADGLELSVSTILPHVGRLIAVHADAPVDPLDEAGDAQWYIVPPDGTEPFGPADPRLVRQWMREGRIVARSLVWRQDWSDWRKAGSVWPTLALEDVGAPGNRIAPRLNAAIPTVPVAATPAAAKPAAALARPANMQAVPAASTSPGKIPLAQPAAQPPSVPPSSGDVAGEIYYPRRSNAVYLAIVGLLLVGLLALSVALFYVLDRMERKKKPAAAPDDAVPTATVPIEKAPVATDAAQPSP